MRKPVWENAVYTKEMRSWRRMKSARWFRLLYLALMLFFFLCAAVLTITDRIPDPDPGRFVFAVVSYLELLAALIFSTAFAAATITSEREMQTLASMAATTLTPQQIVTGKFAANASRLGTLVYYSLPPLVLAAVLHQIGFDGRQEGPTLGRILASQAVVISVILFGSAIGVFASSLFSRTGSAIAAAISAMVVVCFGAPAVPSIWLRSYMWVESGYMVSAVLAVLRVLAGAAILAFVLLAAIVVTIHSTRPGFRRERVWYLALYGLLVITLTALVYLPPVNHLVIESATYYDYDGGALLSKMLSPTVAMRSIVSEARWYQPYASSTHGYSTPRLWMLQAGDLSVWPWLVLTYLPLTAIVIALARLRAGRMRWET